MRHYEIVLLLHPEHGAQIETLLEHFKQLIESQQGCIHRFENLGRRGLAYEVNRLSKAYYSLMNVEIKPETLKLLEEQFQYNETVLRHLILKMDKAVVQPSALMKSQDSLEKDASLQAQRNHSKPRFRSSEPGEAVGAAAEVE